LSQNFLYLYYYITKVGDVSRGFRKFFKKHCINMLIIPINGYQGVSSIYEVSCMSARMIDIFTHPV